MLKKLCYSVTFPTGKTLANEVDFPNGSLAISGPNGTGKSLILEMVTYALFGSEATRGTADDYKQCTVLLGFSINGNDYAVYRRNGNNASLHRDGEPLATGTRAVNAKVVEILGYSLSVFQVANLIGQGQIEALSTMKAAERKRLVDVTIGLDVIDATADWANTQALEAKHRAELLRELLREPIEPVKPEDYVSSHTLHPMLEELTRFKTEKDQLNGWLSQSRMLPTRPNCPTVETAHELNLLVNEFANKKAELESLSKRAREIPDAPNLPAGLDYLQEQLDASVVWGAYNTAKAKLPATPPRTPTQIQQDQTAWTIYHAWDRKENHEAVCPACDHHFSSRGEQPPKPEHSIPKLLCFSKDWAIIANQSPPPTCPSPEIEVKYTQRDLEVWRVAFERAEEKKLITEELLRFVIPEDRSKDLRARLVFDAGLAQYEKEMDRYEQWAAESITKRNRLNDLANVEVELQAVREALSTAQNYESLCSRYAGELVTFNETSARIVETQGRADAFKASVAALKELKLRIKTYLLPSLNRVASYLIQRMTEGQVQELRNVVVDEEFNITVDGQNIDTLNGSGKTVSNLAVRVALGQILTNKVFSVLMCDEVDAACDDERAASIALCLQALTKSIKQVVIVSHKSIEADHYLALNG